MIYPCPFREIHSEDDWRQIPSVHLVDTVKGDQPRLETIVRACWNSAYVSFRFECEDDHIVATYKFRDDPLYFEDVVEIFIDESGEGKHYKEFEISPNNVLFDALIDNDLKGSIQINEKWNAEGIKTESSKVKENGYIYRVDIPHSIFFSPPQTGLTWRINFFRIDDDPQGNRHFWAWSPTGLNFHTPARFGRLEFV